MPYIAPEVITEAKRMDLLTYLRTYEPGELVRYSGNTYCTREHDSLKISNGKWIWWSRGIGGRSALDYLIKVKGYSFLEAVETIIGHTAIQAPEVLRHEVCPKGKVAVIGGGLVGLETADTLATDGCEVTVLEMKDSIGSDLGSLRKIAVMMKMQQLQVKLCQTAKYVNLQKRGLCWKTERRFHVNVQYLRLDFWQTILIRLQKCVKRESFHIM